ncbi:MAG: hypothetical protein HQ582_34475 [Planctomycetes bacterium]|nr:hypothetical protein [Planctomycetota bacterium]
MVDRERDDNLVAKREFAWIRSPAGVTGLAQVRRMPGKQLRAAYRDGYLDGRRDAAKGEE